MHDPRTITIPGPLVHTHDPKKDRAKRACDALNAGLGWAGAQPEYGRDGYTGSITLSARAAEETAVTVFEARLRRFDARTRDGAHTPPECPQGREFSDPKVTATAYADLANVGTAEDPRR
jgi:hypothetical protein